MKETELCHLYTCVYDIIIRGTTFAVILNRFLRSFSSNRIHIFVHVYLLYLYICGGDDSSRTHAMNSDNDSEYRTCANVQYSIHDTHTHLHV